MIIMHELPSSFVDYDGFSDVLDFVAPDFNGMSRNTLKSEVMKLYEVEKSRTMMMFDENTSRIAITTDMWTSNQKKGYMVVTAHFIDNTWKLRSRILRFIYVPAPHNAITLADELWNCLLDWNVDGKLSALTVDSCTANDSMIKNYLLPKFSTGSLLLGGKLFHMRCSAHILNLIVNDGLDVIGDGVEKVRETQCDSQYKNLPSESEWELAKVMCEHLKHFYKLTNLFSRTNYPTTNLLFPMICEMKLSLKSWLDSDVEMQKGRYPILSKIARDVLAIPVSIVASESAFSTGGRTLSSHRSILHPHTAEALMCTQNWIWAQRRGLVPEDEILRGEVMDEDDE
ncbi:hypothetical protein Dsin_024801 [Dipteronia sinensis]|uniref:HAT C-terminal dimerisation domain-containing protein n=1 Tax=Dipteronia sinensis TaxID=43782 RepID=A0AAD9ZV75_9ROSI|nr:hypothetical protein Dsin_024801 [Dipteronia sinensis]